MSFSRDIERRLRRMVSKPLPDASSDFDLNKNLKPNGRKLTPAAVLVPIYLGADGASIVLTKRGNTLRHHPGQIAFPGGKVDPGDGSELNAALREAHEEIGLNPELVDVVGQLPKHETVTSFIMQPYIGLVKSDFNFQKEVGEVDEVFEIPFSHITDTQNFQIHTRPWQGIERRYFAVPYGPYYIWGATARVLKLMSDMYRSSDD